MVRLLKELTTATLEWWTRTPGLVKPGSPPSSKEWCWLARWGPVHHLQIQTCVPFTTRTSHADFLQVQDGTVDASFPLAEIDLHLQKHMNQTLNKLQQIGSQLYLRVIVTNVQSKVVLLSSEQIYVGLYHKHLNVLVQAVKYRRQRFTFPSFPRNTPSTFPALALTSSQDIRSKWW